MHMNGKHFAKRALCAGMSAALLLTMTGCAQKKAEIPTAQTGDVEVYESDKEVIFYSASPIIPDSIEWKESASGMAMTYAQTLIPDLTITFRNFIDDPDVKITFDEACVERIRTGVDDDIYTLNSDVITNMGREGLLADLSDVEGADTLLPAVRAACTVDGKLVAFPREYLAYALIVNNDILKEHGLEIPKTIDDFFACCEKLKADGMETPMLANRWWLECFVLAQGFQDFSDADKAEQLIADLNSGATKMSTYMRPGFEFLKTCMDKGYINAEQALTYEAFDERDAFLAGESAFMTSFTSAVTGAGRKLNNYTFDLRVVGFPTDAGQVALINATGMSIPAADKNMENAKRTLAAVCSAEAVHLFCDKAGSFAARNDVETTVASLPVLTDLVADINANRMVSASNPSINMELWGNTCVVVRQLLAGGTVDECMAEIDRLQQEANEAVAK